MLGSFNNWKIIQFNTKTTSGEDFDAVHKVVLYGTSENISSLVQFFEADTTTMGYYVRKYLSEPHTLQ